jgi:nucleoside-diphosphate-sugar epimerase
MSTLGRGRPILVTGGTGFLGQALIRALVGRGETVRSFARTRSEALEGLGVGQLQGDLADSSAVARAVQGCDLMFHVGAKAGIWGPYSDYARPNVEGTRNVLDAARTEGMSRLVYTSSPSVVFTGGDQEGIDESTPYPKRYLGAYPRTKAIAEASVLSANGPGFATVALRPHLIWGPGDHHLIPRLVERTNAGTLRRIGLASCLVDSTYVDNAVHAHLLAAERLAPGSVPAGRAYFIAQGEPTPLWDLIDRILGAIELPPTSARPPIPAPRWAAYGLGACGEVVHRLLRRSGEPPMTRFLAMQLTHAHWFRLDAARRDLGYAPLISLDEGLRRLKASWKTSGRTA